MPLSVVTSTQGPALGSALHAAVAAGAYPDVPTAAKAMGHRQQAAFTPDRRERRGLRPAVRRLPRAARPLRPRRERRHAHPQGDPSGGRTHDRHDPDVGCRARDGRPPCAPRWPTCTASWSATAWSSGPPATSAPGCPGRDLMVIKPSGVSYDDLDADAIVVTDLFGDLRRGRPRPVLGHRRPRLRVPAHARTSGGSCTRTPPTPPPGPPAASRSRACSPWSPTSSAARSRSARSR